MSTGKSLVLEELREEMRIKGTSTVGLRIRTPRGNEYMINSDAPADGGVHVECLVAATDIVKVGNNYFLMNDLHVEVIPQSK